MGAQQDVRGGAPAQLPDSREPQSCLGCDASDLGLWPGLDRRLEPDPAQSSASTMAAGTKGRSHLQHGFRYHGGRSHPCRLSGLPEVASRRARSYCMTTRGNVTELARLQLEKVTW